tara:strand:+ start:736 stop:1032 length:297 start_codon:yes stop_codon:yes gene_type:complete
MAAAPQEVLLHFALLTEALLMVDKTVDLMEDLVGVPPDIEVEEPVLVEVAQLEQELEMLEAAEFQRPMMKAEVAVALEALEQAEAQALQMEVTAYRTV